MNDHTAKALAANLYTNTAEAKNIGQILVVPHPNLPGEYFVTCTNATKWADKHHSSGCGGFGTYKTLAGALRRADKEFERRSRSSRA